MITSLLKISKFDAGTAVLHKEPVELAAVVEQALAPFIIQAELRQMTLAVDCRQGQFLGDRLWTVEAVQNIVKNCLEHMDNGGTLRLTGTQTALYCQLVIADDGCGIEKRTCPISLSGLQGQKRRSRQRWHWTGAEQIRAEPGERHRGGAKHRRRRYHLYHSILSEYYLRALTDGSYGGRILSAPTRALL